MDSTVFLIIAVWSVACSGQTTNTYRGYKVYRLHPETSQQMEFLIQMQNLLDARGGNEVEFWSGPSQSALQDKSSILIMIAPELQNEVLREFDIQNITHQVTIDDLAALIKAESSLERPNQDSGSLVKAGQDGGMTWTAYHRYLTIEKYVRYLGDNYPDIAKVRVLGRSYEGRDIYQVKLGKPRPDGKTKPAIWMDSHIHAREWITSATVTHMMNRMVADYNSNTTVTKMLDDVDWYFIPVVNPDGVEFTHTSDRMWRGTRRVNPFNTCLGADANRNYDFQWMASGGSQNPCGQTYAGAYPLSEVENLILTEAVLELKDQLKALFTIHSYQQAFLVPWGFDRTSPDDVEDLKALGRRAASALQSQFGTVFKVGGSTEILGAAAGSTDDWAKAKAGIKYVYTLEIRDTGSYGFLLPANQIIPSGIETFEAFTEVYKTVFEEFGPTLDYLSPVSCI